MNLHRKHALLFGFLVLLLLTSLIYLPQNQFITKFKFNSSISNNSSLVLNETRTTMDNQSAEIKSIMKDDKFIENHYFRCADPLGRLGNLMFQFSSGFGIAHTLRYKPCIESSHPLNNHFEIRQICRFKLTNLMTLDENQCRNNAWKYNKEYLSHNLTTAGYLQSWQYFRNISQQIKEAFTFKPTFIQKARQFIESIKVGNKTLVGVHVRRGDFASKQYTELGYTVADTNYIVEALEFYRKRHNRILFVIASDDIGWCKQNIKGPDIIYSNFSEPADDMALLSLCYSTIITGGSFGWWSGWLAGGTVVYMKNFPRPGSWLEKQMHKREDYYLPHWIGL